MTVGDSTHPHSASSKAFNARLDRGFFRLTLPEYQQHLGPASVEEMARLGAVHMEGSSNSGGSMFSPGMSALLSGFQNETWVHSSVVGLKVFAARSDET